MHLCKGEESTVVVHIENTDSQNKDEYFNNKNWRKIHDFIHNDFF